MTKRRIGMIDLAPTWRGLMPLLITALQEGTPQAQSSAREELFRLADHADRMNRFSKNLTGLIAEVAATPPEEIDIMAVLSKLAVLHEEA